jgi:hypothetical protein
VDEFENLRSPTEVLNGTAGTGVAAVRTGGRGRNGISRCIKCRVERVRCAVGIGDRDDVFGGGDGRSGEDESGRIDELDRGPLLVDCDGAGGEKAATTQDDSCSTGGDSLRRRETADRLPTAIA